MPKSDGGPAFPSTFSGVTEGMTLRDWFAGQALIGIRSAIRDVAEVDITQQERERLSACTYQWADAMLAEREK